MPAAPRILAQLGGLLLDPNADLSDVIELLKHDSGLTTRVIRVSNSAVYGVGTRAASLEEALMRVGFNEVYRLVGLAAVAQISDDSLHSYGVSAVRFRENSLFCAFVMEVLAPGLQLDPRAAYTAGLLRSTGKIAIDRLTPGPAYTRSYGVAGKGRPLDQWEVELVGLDNCAAAAVIMEEWRFPSMMSLAIKDHYRPGEKSDLLAHLMNVAAGATEDEGVPFPGEQTYWENRAASVKRLGLQPDDLESGYRLARIRFESAREAIG